MTTKYNNLTKTVVVTADTTKDKKDLNKTMLAIRADKRSCGGVSVNNKQLTLSVVVG